jgi:hypothetical protein
MFTDKNRLRNLRDILNQALRQGFESISSPIEPLIQLMIDLSLQLKFLFGDQQTYWTGKKNPGLRFLDTEQDSLGNPKQIRINFPGKRAYDEGLEEYFSDLAEELAYIASKKRLPSDLRDIFLDEPVQRHSSRRRKLTPQNYHYFRRTRKKRN